MSLCPYCNMATITRKRTCGDPVCQIAAKRIYDRDYQREINEVRKIKRKSRTSGKYDISKE